MIDLKNITVQIATKELLKNASLYVPDGFKVGIIGDNGCGKSTLFKVLLNNHECSSGEVVIPENLHIATVEQIITETEKNILSFVLSKDKILMDARKEYEKADEMEKPFIADRLKFLKSESAENRVARILNGLGFSNDDLEKPVSAFSGGWRMRLALAGALFQSSDILLLDEPTNHLDLEATLWLEDHLKKYTGTILLISHDRNILNQVCTHIVHFSNNKLKLYKGNYNNFKTTYNLEKKVLEKSIEKINQKREHMQAFIERFRYKASKAKQAQSRLKMLEKMGEAPEIDIETKEKFEFPEPENLLPPLVKVENVDVGYGEKTILRKLNFSLSNNERIALLGKNGNGKSTLAKLLAQELNPQKGNLKISDKVKIGYFSQHLEEKLPLDLTPLDFFKSLMKDETETKVRNYLARFGVKEDKATTKMNLLSGGEKARILFAFISLNKPEIIILDEPTNHLDIKGREALADALNLYKGSVILITHDFYLLESVIDDLWLVDKGTCLPYKGDLAEYKELLLEKTKEKEPQKKVVKQKPSILDKSNLRKIKAQLLDIERKIDDLTLKKEALQSKFQEKFDAAYVLNAKKELNEIENKIALLEEEWMNLSEKIL